MWALWLSDLYWLLHLQNMICLTREVDLFTTWTPAISQAEQLQQLAPNELLVHLVLWAPWPMPAPELLLHAVGADLLEQEQAVLLACNGMMEVPVRKLVGRLCCF